MPVLILSRAQPDAQKTAANFAVLVDVQPVFEETPASVNDLGALFDCDCLLAAGEDMLVQLHILWSEPFPFSIDFHPLLFVDDPVMEDTLDFDGITFCRVGVENNVTVLKPFHSQWLPFNFSNSTGAWSAKFGDDWLQAMEDKRLRFTSLDNAAPLLPVQLSIHDLLVKRGFIGFHVLPFSTLPKFDVLLLVPDPPFT